MINVGFFFCNSLELSFKKKMEAIQDGFENISDSSRHETAL